MTYVQVGFQQKHCTLSTMRKKIAHQSQVWLLYHDFHKTPHAGPAKLKGFIFYCWNILPGISCKPDATRKQRSQSSRNRMQCQQKWKFLFIYFLSSCIIQLSGSKLCFLCWPAASCKEELTFRKPAASSQGRFCSQTVPFKVIFWAI